jgi:hypothetical protein
MQTAYHKEHLNISDDQIEGLNKLYLYASVQN